MSEKQLAQAKKVYATMLEALKQEGWKFEKTDDLFISSTYVGNDFEIVYQIQIDAERECFHFMSEPFATFPPERRDDGAKATCIANHGLVFGHFDLDLDNGEIRYSLADSFTDSELGVGFFKEILDTALTAADLYNDRFLMLATGLIDIKRFIELD